MFLSEGESRDAIGKMPAERDDGDIYNLCPRAKWEFDVSSIWEMRIYLNVGDND